MMGNWKDAQRTMRVLEIRRQTEAQDVSQVSICRHLLMCLKEVFCFQHTQCVAGTEPGSSGRNV